MGDICEKAEVAKGARDILAEQVEEKEDKVGSKL